MLNTKKKFLLQSNCDPFPIFKNEIILGIFTGFSVEINNPVHAMYVYINGCYGKSLNSKNTTIGKHKRKKSHDKIESLVLDMEESFFLLQHLKILNIYDIKGEQQINADLMFKHSLNMKPNFVECYISYIYLKSKNWVVKSGMKFGGDFLIYRQGLHFYHASCIVIVSRGAYSTVKYIQGIQRIAETSDKQILFLEVYYPSQIKEVTTLNELLSNFKQFTISEVIPKRFDITQHVQIKK